MKCHGEYKSPGGKLVVADFEIVQNRLDHVRISGDFFLYPDEAIHLINDALNGAPADAKCADLAQRVRLILGPDVEMLGFDVDAIAQAIRRGFV